MKIKSFELVGFKNMLHGGIHRIAGALTSPVICVIGANGSGKSSMLRELTPYPPVSSNYIKGGGKTITVEHNGHEYVLKSIFNGSKGDHSFICDNVELNESSNSTTQQSLCDIHFDTSNLELQLSSSALDICRMSRVERKKLLMGCYPNDLSFILDYHKNISKKIRNLQANVGMLKGRSMELHANMIGDAEFTRLKGLVDELCTFRVRIDNWIGNTDRLIAKIQESYPNIAHPAESEYPGEFDIDASIQTARNLIATTYRLRRTHGDKFTSQASERIRGIDELLSVHNRRLSELAEHGKRLVVEIDEYEAIADRNVEEEVNVLKSTIDRIQSKISTLQVEQDPSIPIWPMQYVDSVLNGTIPECISSIYNIEVWDPDKVTAYQDRCKELSFKLDMNNTTVHKLTERYNDTMRRVTRAKKSSYNDGCTLPCQLKDNYNSTISELEQEASSIKQQLDTLDVENKAVREELGERTEAVDGPAQILPVVLTLANSLRGLPGIDKLLGEDTIFQVIQNRLSTISNWMKRTVESSATAYTLSQYTRELEDAQRKLQVIEDSKIPAKELISKSLVDKKSMLMDIRQQYDTLQHEISDGTHRRDVYGDILEHVNNTFQLRDIADSDIGRYIKEQEYALYVGVREDLQKYRRFVDQKHMEIDRTVRDQESLHIRLKEEIEPNLVQLNKDLERHLHVEKALSPNTGVPHVYLVRFINSIAAAANAYIRAVWCSELEVCDLSEDKPLDFAFPFKLRGSSVVRDISLGSKGQQEILTLALTLALCNQMQLGNKLPIKVDEPDSGLSHDHRTKLLDMLSDLVRTGVLHQLFIVNHHDSLFTAFANHQVICLDTEGIITPAEYNTDITIDRVTD